MLLSELLPASQSKFQEVADALTGSARAKNCTITPNAYEQVPLPVKTPQAGVPEWFVDAVSGSDTNPGTLQSPVKTIEKGVQLARGLTGARTLFLRAGTFYLSDPIQLGVQDSDLTIAAYDGEEVCLVYGLRACVLRCSVHASVLCVSGVFVVLRVW